MKALIKDLTFDKKIVETLQTSKVKRDVLYNLLNSGKISLKEYLHLTSN